MSRLVFIFSLDDLIFVQPNFYCSLTSSHKTLMRQDILRNTS